MDCKPAVVYKIVQFSLLIFVEKRPKIKLSRLLDNFCFTMYIDRESPIPAYYQIALDLRYRINNGEWRSENRLPSEKELAREYKVSRMTMRQAIAELVKEGLVSRQRGSGTFLNKTAMQVIPHLSNFPISFNLRIRELGLMPSARIIKAQIIPSSADMAHRLGIAPGEPVAFHKRVLLANGEPVALNHSFISSALCPGIITEGLMENSISTTLEQRYQLIPIHAEHWFEAILASDEDARLLEIKSGAPLLLLTTTSYLEDRTPLEFSMTAWVGDRVRLYFSASAEQPVGLSEIQYKR